MLIRFFFLLFPITMLGGGGKYVGHELKMGFGVVRAMIRQLSPGAKLNRVFMES